MVDKRYDAIQQDTNSNVLCNRKAFVAEVKSKTWRVEGGGGAQGGVGVCMVPYHTC